MPFAATWMNLEMIILNKVCQTEKDRSREMILLYAESKTMIQMNLFTKQERTHGLESEFMVMQEGCRRGTDWESWIDMHTLLYLK